MIVGKIFKFDAAHHLPGYDGKCNRLHGHTWKLEVAIAGAVNDQGFVLDFSELSRIVNDVLDTYLDHSCLNDTLKNPTCEHILLWLWPRLSEMLPYPVSYLKLWETETSFAILSNSDWVDIYSKGK